MSILQSLWKRTAPTLVGLDISSSAVKLVELKRRAGEFSVETFSVEPLPANSVVDSQIKDPAAVGEAVRRAFSRAQTKSKMVAVAVSGSSVITKVITLSAGLTEPEMEEQIKAEADQYIPYSIDEVSFDFQVLGPSKETGAVDVLLAACRKEQIESRIAALEIAGLTAQVVDIEAYAMENACQYLRHQMPNGGSGKTVAIVDMGATTTSVLIMSDLKPVYTRDQSFGGRQLNEDIIRYFGITPEEAARGKKSGTLPETYQTDVLPRFFEDMVQQIDRSLQFYFASEAGANAIDQIIIAGGCAQIAGLDAAIQAELRKPVVVARPFAKMKTSSDVSASQLAKEEPSLLIACGLACRAFDDMDE